MYKMLLGITAMDNELIIDREFDEESDPWCDFELDYFPDENCYQFSFETMLGFEPNGARKWINNCLDKLTDYMNDHGYSTERELSLYDVFTRGTDVNTAFESIEDAYAWLKMMIYGFNGKGLI